MIIESSYKNMLQGVSQQIPRERGEGYVTALTNMISDPVTGLRRRPGILSTGRIISGSDLATNKFKYLSLRHGNYFYHIRIDRTTGAVEYDTYDNNMIPVRTGMAIASSNYLRCSDPTKLRYTMLRDEIWVVNTEMKPSYITTESRQDPRRFGFYWVKVGAFSKTYQIDYSIHSDSGWRSFSWAITTPDSNAGDNSGDRPSDAWDADAWGSAVHRASPEGIAAQLVQGCMNNPDFRKEWVMSRQGSVILLQYIGSDYGSLSNPQVVWKSTTGSTYVGISNGMLVNAVTDLPPTMPQVWNPSTWPQTSKDHYTKTDFNSIVAVGMNQYNREYYEWQATRNLWRETGTFGSKGYFTNVPYVIDFSTDAPYRKIVTFEGREAGDDNNNPMPAFMSGITGICTFQGRVGLMSKGFISFSGSNEPTKFFRRTVTNLRADDSFDVGAGAASSVIWEHGIAFNKDLILFSKTHQAVIPGGSGAMSATSTNLQITSWQSVDTRCTPAVVNRTLLYATEPVDGYFAIEELVPSEYSNSLYVPQRLTDHIPEYLAGRCAEIVNSPSQNKVLFRSSYDASTVHVLEYLWNGGERVQAAWYMWKFNNAIMDLAYDGSDILVTMHNVVYDTNEQLITGKLNLAKADTNRYADFWRQLNVEDGWISTAQFQSPYHNYGNNIIIIDPNTMQELGFWADASGRRVKIDAPGVNYVIAGYKYKSEVSPTPPLYRDYKGAVISDANARLIRYVIHTVQSGEYTVTEVDEHREEATTTVESTVQWGSKELGFNHAPQGRLSVVSVPIRTWVDRTNVTISADGPQELNLVDIEYTMKVASRPTRKRM